MLRLRCSLLGIDVYGVVGLFYLPTDGRGAHCVSANMPGTAVTDANDCIALCVWSSDLSPFRASHPLANSFLAVAHVFFPVSIRPRQSNPIGGRLSEHYGQLPSSSLHCVQIQADHLRGPLVSPVSEAVDPEGCVYDCEINIW